MEKRNKKDSEALNRAMKSILCIGMHAIHLTNQKTECDEQIEQIRLFTFFSFHLFLSIPVYALLLLYGAGNLFQYLLCI